MRAEPDVLVLTPDYPPAVGGIQLLLHRLVRQMEGVRPRVVTLGGPGAAGFDRAEGVPTRRVASGPLPRAVVAMVNLAGVAWSLRRRPDVVLCGHVALSPAARAISAVLGVPYVQYLYGAEITARPALTAGAVSSAAACIAVSRHSAGLAREVGGAPRRMEVIPPGVDAPARGPAGDRERVIVTVARMAEWYKGHDVLVRALPLVAARIPDAKWVAIGDGPLRPCIERLALAAGIGERVQFPGALDDAQRDSWLDRATVFAMPSRLSGNGRGGGFGIGYLEAGAHGLPVVAGRAGGAADAVVHGETGLLVDPEDHVAVADAIADLMIDTARAEAMGRAGAARAAALSWQAAAARVGALLREVARGA